jgi:hypothetical protein
MQFTPRITPPATTRLKEFGWQEPVQPIDGEMPPMSLKDNFDTCIAQFHANRAEVQPASISN